MVADSSSARFSLYPNSPNLFASFFLLKLDSKNEFTLSAISDSSISYPFSLISSLNSLWSPCLPGVFIKAAFVLHDPWECSSLHGLYLFLTELQHFTSCSPFSHSERAVCSLVSPPWYHLEYVMQLAFFGRTEALAWSSGLQLHFCLKCLNNCSLCGCCGVSFCLRYPNNCSRSPLPFTCRDTKTADLENSMQGDFVWDLYSEGCDLTAYS